MKDEEDVVHDGAQIEGRTAGPFGSDDADVDVRAEDNRNNFEQENSANGLDSLQVRGGQDGRNERGIGSTDMDSQNGVLRLGDQDDSTMQVPDAAISDAVASEGKTNTAMVDVTTAGPDDYASAEKVGVPNAQKAAKEQNGDDEDKPSTEAKSQVERDEEIAETGTDLTNEPTY